jgi:Zn-dependent protease with chaperone function
LLLLVPFVKGAIEIGRGIPKDGFFWTKLEGARQNMRTLQLGLGADWFGPVVSMTFGAQYRKHTYPQSAGDLLSSGIERFTSPSMVGALLASSGLLVLSVAIVRALRSIFACRAARRSGIVVETRRIALRMVRIIESNAWHGVPFAGGLLRPYVCLPTRTELTREEREAVILHELAHIRHFDLVTLAFVRLVHGVLWFVPGASHLARLASTQCEIVADVSALAHGAIPEALASALVRMKEHAAAPVGLVRESSFVQRVERLLDPPSVALRLPKLALYGLVTITLLRMTVFGNR